MQYMLLIYGDEAALTQPQREACYAESIQLARDLRADGKFVASSPLHNTATATSVRMRAGKRMITDGPFAETREQLGGYYVVDVADLDEAIAIASKIPGARHGTVEIRPVVELDGLKGL